jgi:hypothetical protein
LALRRRYIIHVDGPSAGQIINFCEPELARGPYFAHHWSRDFFAFQFIWSCAIVLLKVR